MIKRIFLQLTCLVILLVSPTLSLGTGLGAIQVKSNLGEPLYAEIDLLGISQEEAGSLQVKVASSDEYLTAGLNDFPVLREIRFDVLQKDDGFRLILRTRRPVNEPFLDLLIHMDAPSMRLYRQYTLLLDPPLSVKDEAYTPPSRNRVESEWNEESAFQPTERVKPKKKVRQQQVDISDDPEAAPVKKKKRSKQRQQEEMESTTGLVADKPLVETAESYLTKEGDIFGKVAQRYQPEGVRLKDVMAAFYAANPEAFENGDMNQLKAGQLLKIPDLQQLASGKSRKHKATESQQPPKPNEPEAKSAKSAEPKFVLRLSSGDSDAAADSVAASNNKPIEANASSTAPAVEQAPAVSPPPQEPMAIEPPVLAPAPVTPPPVVNVPPPTPATQTTTVTASEKSSYDMLMTYMIWLTEGLIGLLALGVLYFLFALVKSKFQKKSLDELVDTGLINRLGKTSTLGAVTSLKADDFGADDFLHNTIFPNTGHIVDLHEVDPIIESEVYSAYGRYEQAALILESAVKKAPHQNELKIALMKVYVELRDYPGFESLFLDIQEDVLQSGGDREFLTTAIKMGAKFEPENPLYRFEDITKVQEDKKLGADDFFNVDEATESELDTQKLDLSDPDDGDEGQPPTFDEQAEPTELAAPKLAETSEPAYTDTVKLVMPVAVDPAIKNQSSSMSDDLKMLKENNVVEFEVIKIPETTEEPEQEKTFSEFPAEEMALDAPVISFSAQNSVEDSEPAANDEAADEAQPAGKETDKKV